MEAVRVSGAPVTRLREGPGMSLRVNTNTAAFNAYRNLSATDTSMSKSLEKLSSGLRINRAGDDAAGLVISENLRSQIGGIKQAVRNAQDGISVVQTAEGALNEVQAMLQRMRDLAVQAANTGSNGTTAVAAAQAEVNQLISAIGDIASRTTFNGTALLATSGGSSLTFQTGANSGETLTVSLTDMGVNSLGISSLSLASASSVISTLDTAINTVSTQRGNFGAAQNRLEHTINNLNVTEENLSASESQIRDTDMASEMTNFSKQQILMQAGTSMLAQANSAPQAVLQLLRG
jgi:flagellin